MAAYSYKILPAEATYLAGTIGAVSKFVKKESDLPTGF